MKVYRFEDICPGVIEFDPEKEYIIVAPMGIKVGLTLPENISLFCIPSDEPDFPFKCEGTD